MRPIFVRVLTGALAITGTAGAIALPQLTLGVEATAPPYVFAIPAPAAEVVIMADPAAPAARAAPRPQATAPSATAPAGSASPAVPTRRRTAPGRSGTRARCRSQATSGPRSCSLAHPGACSYACSCPEPAPAPEPDPSPRRLRLRSPRSYARSSSSRRPPSRPDAENCKRKKHKKKDKCHGRPDDAGREQSHENDDGRDDHSMKHDDDHDRDHDHDDDDDGSGDDGDDNRGDNGNRRDDGDKD